MYTIISATHRPGSMTFKVAKLYLQILQDQGIETQVLSLENLPADFLFTDSFGKRSERFQQIIDVYLAASRKFIVISPEYNGGMPGIFKAFLDAATPEHFRGKKVALVGVASGRGGNSRGMEHQVSCFHYLGVDVFHKLVPISQVQEQFNAKGEPAGGADGYVLKSLHKQAEGFILY